MGDKCESAGGLASLVNNDESLPIGAVGVTGKNAIGLGVKKYASVAGGETATRRVHFYREQFIVSGEIEKFFPIAPPEWAAAVATGNLPFPSGARKGYDVDAVLA